MESELEDIRTPSISLDKEIFQKQLAIIKNASEQAQAKIDYYSAHDDHIMHAIEIVEEFLRKRHRICYGGQAINAHLPQKYKFYDPEYSIPDYDFFTPSQTADIELIVNDLKKAGFNEISAREGMHEGTVKIYVEYIPVADITEIDPKLYKILSKREYRMNGISYLDANSLRMLMYLELSRPRGEVERWKKVYERLLLFNEFAMGKSCNKRGKGLLHGSLSNSQVQFVLDFIIHNKRVFAGADLAELYQDALKKNALQTDWIITSKKPILFFSSDPAQDAKELASEFRFELKQPHLSDTKKGRITTKTYSSKGVDLIPSITVISQGKRLLVMIIHQTACHSYFNIPIDDDKVMRIASMDSLITLYFGLGLLKTAYFDMGSMECLANELVQINSRARQESDHFIFPFISIRCAGHQHTLPSLIREKVKRITSKKKLLQNLFKNNAAPKTQGGNHKTQGGFTLKHHRKLRLI